MPNEYILCKRDPTAKAILLRCRIAPSSAKLNILLILHNNRALSAFSCPSAVLVANRSCAGGVLSVGDHTAALILEKEINSQMSYRWQMCVIIA